MLNIPKNFEMDHNRMKRDLLTVENVEVSKPQARKVLINQSLYLVMPNGDVYDISGRQVR